MAQTASTILSSTWSGLMGLPVFDLPITWGALMIGVVVIGVSLKVLHLVFGIGSMESEIFRAGRNARKKSVEARKKAESQGYGKDAKALSAYASRQK